MQWKNRHLDRCGTMTREERDLEPVEGEAIHPEPKRPRIPSLQRACNIVRFYEEEESDTADLYYYLGVIVEALKVDSLQKIFSSFEPVLRKVVSEEVECALARFEPARLVGRSAPKLIEGLDGRKLQLHFRSRLSVPLFTGGKVEGEEGSAINVVLLDANTGHVVASGPESSAKLDVVVLEGDFNNEDNDDWTWNEFASHVVKERQGKGPLLTGDLQISLKEGFGTLGELTFMDNSSWIRSRKFRLGVKIVPGFCEGIRVREAKTDAFMVKDHRGELYKKHFPPALNDEVWRLEKIGKDGSFHKRLNKAGIYTVEDLLRVVVRDPQRLRKILGSSMSNKMWEALVDHARTCVLSGKHYVYYLDNTRNAGAIFNNIYEFTGLLAGGQYCSAESLTASQKVFSDSLVKKAYNNWMHVVEYDGKALLTFNDNKETTAPRRDLPSSPSSHPISHKQQESQHHSSVAAPTNQCITNTRIVEGISSGQHRIQVTKLPPHPQHMLPITQVEITSFTPRNHLFGASHQSNMLRANSMAPVLGSPQQASLEFQAVNPPNQSSNSNLCDLWPHQRNIQAVDYCFTEQEICMRRHGIHENEDTQDLFHVVSSDRATVTHGDKYSFSSYVHSPCPNFNFDKDHLCPSRAYAGWLKIKAAMRWGIFVRKKAAERRAQLMELED